MRPVLVSHCSRFCGCHRKGALVDLLRSLGGLAECGGRGIMWALLTKFDGALADFRFTAACTLSVLASWRMFAVELPSACGRTAAGAGSAIVAVIRWQRGSWREVRLGRATVDKITAMGKTVVDS